MQKQPEKRFAIYEAQTTFSQIRINKSEEQNSLQEKQFMSTWPWPQQETLTSSILQYLQRLTGQLPSEKNMNKKKYWGPYSFLCFCLLFLIRKGRVLKRARNYDGKRLRTSSCKTSDKLNDDKLLYCSPRMLLYIHMYAILISNVIYFLNSVIFFLK